MGYSSSDFQGEAILIGDKHYNGGRMTQAAIDAVYGSLGSAVTADAANNHDVTLATPGGALSPSTWPDDLHRELQLLINKGRNSLGPAAMGSILTSLSTANIFPPVNTVAPAVSATSLSVAAAGVASCTTGTWTEAPTSYTYQWRRGGTNIGGAAGSTYTLQAADVGLLITCNVTAINAAGSAQQLSNAIGPVTA